ncbi:hypothetical protein [Methanococcoides sp. FTZ1]|uniref:hypothetical protein n=1 Tax=Methanococcoides sp. FTZ1 TaxID=3439061 RepID=UPI003F83A2DB
MSREAPYYKCSRFSKCAVNNCPLSPLYPNLPTDPEDPETKCTLAKSYRLKIDSKYLGVLQYGGMTKREHAGKVTWENMPESTKATIRKEGQKRLNTLRSQKDNLNPMVLDGGVV